MSNTALSFAHWETSAVGEIDDATEWGTALAGVEVVIHAAARVHVMHDHSTDPLSEFRRVNTLGSGRLAREAFRQGVRRLVYISSVKVNGEFTPVGSVLRETDALCPLGPYAVSKCEAERVLSDFSAKSGLEFVIVRPPLVYGPHAGGNLATLFSLVFRGLPLPLAGVDNARSMIGLDNLAHFLGVCATHPAAAGQTFLVSDGRAVSTPELLRLLAAGMGKQSRLYRVPDCLMDVAAAIPGLNKVHRRICQSLVVDISKAASVLGWQAPMSVEEGLDRTGSWYAAAMTSTRAN
jgi:UDP-glucose 4-epimerase